MAVLTAWTFASATLGSSVPLLVLHRRHRRFLWRSCALLSGSDCCRFWQAQHYIPEALNSQCHRHSHTKSDAAGKMIYPSCRTLLLSAPVCIVHRHLDIFSARFCVHGLPLFCPFLHLFFERILHNLLFRGRGHSCKKIKNYGRAFCGFLNAKGARGKFPICTNLAKMLASVTCLFFVFQQKNPQNIPEKHPQKEG